MPFWRTLVFDSRPHLGGQYVLYFIYNEQCVFCMVLHDVVQNFLQEKQWDTPWLETCVDTTPPTDFGDFARAGATLSLAKDEI